MKRAAISIIKLALLTSLLLTLVGCGTPGPVEAWNKFVKDVQSKNYDNMWNEVTELVQEKNPRVYNDPLRGQTYDIFINGFFSQIRNYIVNGAPVTGCEIEGDRAILKYKSGDSILTAEMVKENGKWKVDLVF